MPFYDPIAGGVYLIIPALRSPNYQAGVSGWTINRDGTAEFGDAVIRGSLDVTDPDGSRVHIFDQDPGTGAIIDMYPATVPAHLITTPAEIRHVLLTTNRPALEIEGATIDGVTPGPVMQMYADELGNQSISLIAPNLALVGILDNQSPSLAGPGLLTVQNADINIVNDRVGFTSTMEIDGGIRAGERIFVGSILHNTTIGTETADSYQQGPSPADTRAVNTFADIKNAAGGTYQHTYDKIYGSSETDLEVTLNLSLFITVAASGYTFQMRDSGSATTQHMVTSLMNPLADHHCLSITRKFTGLPAVAGGTLTVQWSRVSGGTLNRDQNDYVNVYTREVGIKT